MKARKFDVATTEASFNVQNGARFFALRNDGANDIRINFKTQPSPQHYTLKPGEKTPDLHNEHELKVNYWSVGGPSKLEGLFWR